MTAVLANGLNVPLALGFGLLIFLPLTFFVAAVESLVFRSRLHTGYRTAFKPILVANLWSSLAGVVLLIVQGGVISAAGLMDTIPTFAHAWRWLAPLLILVYFCVSVLVEGWALTRRKSLSILSIPRRPVWTTVFLANVASYCFIGPLFHFANRPHFGGLDTTFDAVWTANPDLVFYYIDPNTEFVMRRRLGDREGRTLLPHRAASFLVSADESAVVYLSSDDYHLFAWRDGEPEPILIRRHDEGRCMHTVSLSPDNHRVAYLSPRSDTSDSVALWLIDLDTQEVVDIGSLVGAYRPIAFSADGDTVYVFDTIEGHLLQADGRELWDRHFVRARRFNAHPPYDLHEVSSTAPPLSALVENYLRPFASTARYAIESWTVVPPAQRADGYEIELTRFFGGRLRVTRNGQEVLWLQDEFGLLNLNWPPFFSAAFLPCGDEMLVNRGDPFSSQLYVVDLGKRRIGYVGSGIAFVLRTPEFRITFDDSCAQPPRPILARPVPPPRAH